LNNRGDRRNRHVLTHLVATQGLWKLPTRGAIKELNKPVFGKAFCPLLGRKGAAARVSSFSRKLGVL
jgi:hypothetical protein